MPRTGPCLLPWQDIGSPFHYNVGGRVGDQLIGTPDGTILGGGGTCLCGAPSRRCGLPAHVSHYIPANPGCLAGALLRISKEFRSFPLHSAQIGSGHLIPLHVNSRRLQRFRSSGHFSPLRIMSLQSASTFQSTHPYRMRRAASRVLQRGKANLALPSPALALHRFAMPYIIYSGKTRRCAITLYLFFL